MVPSGGEADYPARSGAWRGESSFLLSESHRTVWVAIAPCRIAEGKGSCGFFPPQAAVCKQLGKATSQGQGNKPSGVDFCLFKLLKMKKLYCFQSGVAQPQLDVTPLTAAGPCQEPRDSLLAPSMGKCESPLPCSPARPNAAARGDHECDLLLRAVRAGCDQLLPQGSTAPAAAWERKCWVWLRDPAEQNSRREAGPPSLTMQQDGTREAGPGGRVWALGRTPLSS